MNFVDLKRWVWMVPSSLMMAIPAFSQTLSSGYQDLGVLNGGSESAPFGISANASVVVGEATDRLAGFNYRAFRWTQATGMTSLGTLNDGYQSAARGVSADGSVVVGESADGAAGNWSRAFRWTEATGMTSLGTLNGGLSSGARAASSDGSVVVGTSADGAAGNRYRAFRWTQATGMTSLGVLNGGVSSSATAVSSDGSVVVGGAHDGAIGNAPRAFRWTQATGITSLGTLNGGDNSVARGVSSDGSVVVGESVDGAANNTPRAFRWTQTTGMTSLGALNNGAYSTATAVSANGGVVVGWANDGATNRYSAFRWTPAGGLQTVEQWLTAAGVSVNPDFISLDANAVSADGSVVAGRLDNEHAFIARVTPQGSGAIDYPAFLATVIGASHTSSMGSQQADLVMHGLRGSPVQSLPAAGQQTAWVAGDWGLRDHLTDDGNIASGEMGYARGLSDQLIVKIALGKTRSTQHLSYGGGATLQGTYAIQELVYRLPESQKYVTFSGYYNDGAMGSRRRYLNAGNEVQSVGDTDVCVTAMRMRLDFVDALNLGKNSISPYVSLTYIHSRRDGYTEVGGGFPVQWDSWASTTTQARLGGDSRYQFNEQVSLLGRLEGVYRLEGKTSGGTGQILDLGGFDAGDVPYRRTWLRAAAGVEAKLGPGTATFMLNGTTDSNAASLWAYANYRVAF